MSEAENLYSTEYFEYLQNRGSLRRWVRTFYLKDIASYCIGKCIDFGCGTGELLKILPEGSIGFEINPIATAYCKANGLSVDVYHPQQDDYRFDMIPENVYTTFTMNHVLEHIDDSHLIMRKIFNSCHRLGIKRIVFTVPGMAGYRSDATHRTFIDREYLASHDLTQEQNYKLIRSKYFPFPMEAVGKIFTHNELRLIYDHTS